MNKKADFIWTLTKILLILIVVVVVLFGGGRLILDAGKSALGIFGLVNITEADYHEINQNAKLNFNRLINDIELCKSYKDDNCLCSSSFEGFDNIHNLEINDREIKLINSKDDNQITMDKKELQNFNCYYDKTSLKTENPLIIIFDEELPRIKKETLNMDFLAEDVNLEKNPYIYKSAQVCLASKDFDAGRLDKCKTIEKLI